MKIQDIEPVLQDVVAYFRFTDESVFSSIAYDKDEIVEALEALLKRVNKTITNKIEIDIAIETEPKPKNHGKSWTEKLHLRLEKMIVEEFDPKAPKKFYVAASERFGRTPGAIRAKLYNWGLIIHPYDPGYSIKKLEEFRHKIT